MYALVGYQVITGVIVVVVSVADGGYGGRFNFDGYKTVCS